MSKSPGREPSRAELSAEVALLRGEVDRLTRERDEAWDALRAAGRPAAGAAAGTLGDAMREGAEALGRVDARLERMRREDAEAEAEGLRLENESLRAAVDAQGEAYAELAAMRDALEGRYEENLALYRELRDAYENLSEAYAQLLERVKIANARLWCPRSERTVEGQMDFLSLFNDAEATADEADADAPPAEGDAPRRRRPGGGRRRLDLGGLECTVVEHELDDTACPECGHALRDMRVEVTRRLHYRPAELWVEEHRRHVYICPACSAANAAGGETPSVIVRAPAPAAPLGKSPAGADLVADAIHRRFELAQPLRRIELDYASLGADVSRADLANWIMAAARLYLGPMSERMLEALRELDVLHADETTVKVLREPGRRNTSTSWMWVVTSSPPDPPIQVFRYAPTRKGDVIRGMLGGWSGHLMTDGYGPYHDLGAGVVNVACLAHVRRRFTDIVRAYGSGADGRVAAEAVRRLDAMFAVDRALQGMDPEARRRARLESLEPLMRAFEGWARSERAKAPDDFALAKALDHALNRWPFAMNVLDDGRLELSNNRCERAIRPFTLGRRNSLFSGSPRGAAASAACHSVVSTARANGLDATRYLEWLLTGLAEEGAPTGGALDPFMPWARGIPDSLRMTDAERRAAGRDGRRFADPVIPQREIDRLAAEARAEVDAMIG